MLLRLQHPLKIMFYRLDGWGEAIFGKSCNPLYHLGAIGWFAYWIVAGSGIVLYLFFETSVTNAYASVEWITHDLWFFAGILRSLHRYASDLMVVALMLHLLREFAFDRYHSARWFAWFTGIPVTWFLFFCGVSGYWLVWDSLAQYTAIAATEWLDWLGIFSQPIANNFLTPSKLSDRFFSLLVYVHIFVPLALLLLMWVHLLRIARAKTNPPRNLALGLTGALLALSLVVPAVSHAPADLNLISSELYLDWFYLGLFPLYERWGPGALWALTVGASLLLSLLPWLRRPRRQPVAEVDLGNCNGCSRCFADCPFGAVTMQPRSDGRPFEWQPVVNPSLCTSCGICMGACPTTTPFRSRGEAVPGIELPDFTLVELRDRIGKAAARLRGTEKILIFGCDHGAVLTGLDAPAVAAITLPCTGMLSPSFVDYAFSRLDIAGVVITGCREGECYHRLGAQWSEQRLAGERDPKLRERVGRERIRIAWAAPTELARLRGDVAAFRAELAALPPPAAELEPRLAASGGAE